MRTRLVAALVVLGTAFARAGDLDDREILRKVSERVRMSAVVGHLPIEVAASRGRVVLTGRVRTLAQVWEAVERAGSVAGVLDVESRLVLDVHAPSDAAIEAAVKRRFADLPEVASSGVAVRIEKGVATLSGAINDARLRFAAADAAAAVEGVVSVVDHVETPALDDAAILKAVQAILGRRSPVRVAGKIDPTVRSGVVTLEGFVKRAADRRRAERLVLGINGVKDVVDRLVVEPSSPDLLIPLD